VLKRGLIVPDVHAPYHDKRAWKVLLKAAKSRRWDYCVVLGDFFDMYAVSSHSKDVTRSRLLTDEVAVAQSLLDELGEHLGAECDVRFCLGNHEDRLDRYLQERAPELYGTISARNLISDRGWKVYDYKRSFRLGKLFFTHDLGSAGHTAAARAMRAYGGNIVIGHVHSINMTVAGNARGDSHVGASFGWLGDRDAIDYMHRDKTAMDWHLGFGSFSMDEKGNAWLQAHPIINYRTVMDGKVIG
jgi:predicted phosphodiesterase